MVVLGPLLDQDIALGEFQQLGLRTEGQKFSAIDVTEGTAYFDIKKKTEDEFVVFINGQQLVEPYLPADLATEDFTAATVPPDHLWVMGDNRLNSRDSHFFGAIPESSVLGRAIGKVWPPGYTSFL